MQCPIEVFVGATTDVEARVYAEYRAASDEDSTEGGHRVMLAGRLVGPRCEYAHTLPAEFALRDLGPGPTVLAEAVVPDPCCWSPVLPHLYNVEVEARQADRVIARYQGIFGIRRLSARGSSLVLDGKRWVVRGARQSAVVESELAAWHEHHLAMLAADPGDRLCEAASHTGVLVVAELPAGVTDETLRRLARWPAVGVITFPAMVDAQAAPQWTLPRNVLAAQRLAAGQPVRPAGWARIVVCDVTGADETGERLAGCDRPVIAVGPGGPHASAAAARAACDRLQRDLAPRLVLAGYIV